MIVNDVIEKSNCYPIKKGDYDLWYGVGIIRFLIKARAIIYS
jgi:hypothetical protein